MKQRNGGYVGLIILIVSIAIVVFLFARTYLTPTPEPVINESGTAIVTTTTQTGIEAAHINIDAAKRAQEKLNEQNKELNKALGE